MRHRFVAVSATSSGVHAFIKVLISLIRHYDWDLDPEYIRKLNSWQKEADSFRKKFGINKNTYDRAIRVVQKGEDPTESDKADSHISALISEVKENFPDMKKDTDLRKEDVAFINDLRLIYEKDSPAASSRIAKNVSKLADTDINAMFVEERVETNEEEQELRNIVEKHEGSPGLAVSVDTTKKWTQYKEKNGKKHPDHAKYLELKKTLKESFQSRLRTIVRSSGKKMLPVHEVVETLENEGISHTIPHGFRGLIDDLGGFYTTEGKKLAASPTGEVMMNPKYDPKEDNAYVCAYKPPFGADWLRAYTEDKRKNAKKSKFEAVNATMKKLNTYANTWRKDMRQDVGNKDAVLATVCEFIYQTSARGGNKNAKSKDKKTFGATQLLVSHVHLDDNRLIVKYPGKSGGQQKHVIRRKESNVTKRLSTNIERLMKNKSKNDYVFTYNGEPFSGTTSVTNYMRKIGFPKEFTVHKLRTARGTKMAQDIFKKLNKEIKDDTNSWTDKQINDRVEKELLKIGEELGHLSGEKVTTSTAIQNYIDPDLLKSFYNSVGIRPPSKIQKAIDSV